MREEIKERLVVFALGICFGMAITGLFGAGMLIAYKLGRRGIEPMYIAKKLLQSGSTSASISGKNAPSLPKPSDLHISFEDGEIEWFSPMNRARIERSKLFAKDGEYSCAVYAQGAEFPGAGFEVYGRKKVLNASGKNALEFYVYNPGSADLHLKVKIKSGADYPKPSFTKDIRIPKGAEQKVVIPIAEMAGSIDITSISYFNIFLDRPPSDAVIYIDDVRFS